ncbi:MAG: two-component system, chemotaxis family, sensor kinase CheA [Gammaproteobacteria bacterium]|jgi:two-component system chemotaxis sensor kinase CheA|nr:two-component system, chemotaxis family, sensor kinase CheA [Gammaproteobacteria bacterium]
MDLDLAQFHSSFFEESFEALDGMEAALLGLDAGAPDPERVNSIFRVAHSIKGGAGMFGFKDVASFTHTLETLLDELRSGRMQVTRAISDQLLLSVDVLRAMLTAVQRKEPVDMQKVADLQFDLEMIVAQGAAAPTPASVAATPAVAAAVAPAVVTGPGAVAAKAAASDGRWVIEFRALPELLLRGNDPLPIFASLAELGKLTVVANLGAVPRLLSIDAERCYLTWKLELESDCAREQVDAAFEWAAVDCELTINRVEADAGAAAHVTPAAQATPVARPTGAAQTTAAGQPTAAAQTTAAAQPVGTASAAPTPKAAAAEHSSIRVSIEKIDELINTVGELVITQAMLSELGRKLDGAVAEQFRSGLNQLERNMRELQESVMRVRMLPISFTFSRFPRMVRDLAQRLGKQIELKMTGEQTELDKTVMEKIGDPLVHLVRNSVDHGIESPEARVAAGKSAMGTVHLDASHRGGHIAVEIRDDGAGLDKNRILAKARARGLVGANDVLTDEQIHELIFLPGFSTAEKTTDVSGRGVGMDVVRRNVKELGGKIEIGSDFGKGSRFIITLPLTLAIVDGQSVSVGSETYIVPLTSIIESLQLQPQSVSRLSGRGEVFSFRGDYLPIVRLHDLFGVQPRAHALHEGLIVVAEGDGRRIGLFVDELLGQQQVVIKSMEANYGPVDGVAGATILGDGCVALILDLPGLIRVAARTPAAA